MRAPWDARALPHTSVHPRRARGVGRPAQGRGPPVPRGARLDGTLGPHPRRRGQDGGHQPPRRPCGEAPQRHGGRCRPDVRLQPLGDGVPALHLVRPRRHVRPPREARQARQGHRGGAGGRGRSRAGADPPGARSCQRAVAHDRGAGGGGDVQEAAAAMTAPMVVQLKTLCTSVLAPLLLPGRRPPPLGGLGFGSRPRQPFSAPACCQIQGS
mmetsp:Transcript_4161/g.13169  ORF Transcript_4161/g.13169 Transcript_4161/m.13169 type:complete len:212 (-) Transcript_4161:518-1153(-)